MGTCPSKPGELTGVGIGPVIPANKGVNAKKNNSARNAPPGELVQAKQGVNVNKTNTKNTTVKNNLSSENRDKRIQYLEMDLDTSKITDIQELENLRKELEDYVKRFESSGEGGGLIATIERFNSLIKGIDKRIEGIKNGTIKEPSAPELPNAPVNKQTNNKNKNVANNNPTNPPANNTPPTVNARQNASVPSKISAPPPAPPPAQTGGKKTRKTKRKQKHPKKQKKHPKK